MEDASQSERSVSSRDENDEDFEMSPRVSKRDEDPEEDDDDEEEEEESDPVVKPGRSRKSKKPANKRAKLDFGDDLDPELYGLRRSVRLILSARFRYLPYVRGVREHRLERQALSFSPLDIRLTCLQGYDDGFSDDSASDSEDVRPRKKKGKGKATSTFR